MSLFFETIKCYNGKADHLKYHSQRVYNTIQKDIELQQHIIPPNNELLRCKVIYDHTGIKKISYFPYKKREIKKLKVISSDMIEYSYKYFDRTAIDTLYNEKGDCDDIIIIKNGYLTDTSIANICIYKEDKWLTPKTPLLKGTVRERLLQTNQIEGSLLTLEDLLSSKKLALTNAMIDFDILQNFQIIL